MHRKIVQALQQLERAEVLTFHHYAKSEGYVVTTAAGEARSFTAAEAAAYVACASDLYLVFRRKLDDVAAGDEALEELDDAFLEPLTVAVGRIFPEAQELVEDDE
ncbi:hypothetical protein [Streptomyces noursei]